MGIFSKKYYVWNDTSKKLDCLNSFEFDIFLYKLKNPIIKLEVKENYSSREMPSYLQPNEDLKDSIICQLEQKIKTLNETLLTYDKSIGILHSNKAYEYVVPKPKIQNFTRNFESFEEALKKKRLSIFFDDINDIKIVQFKQPTKEEVFQIIEKLLTIETID